MGDSLLLSLLFHTSIIDSILYRQLGKKQLSGSPSDHRYALILSLQSAFLLNCQKYWFPEILMISCRKIISCHYTKRLYQGECSSLGSPLQRCSHSYLVTSLTAWFRGCQSASCLLPELAVVWQDQDGHWKVILKCEMLQLKPSHFHPPYHPHSVPGKGVQSFQRLGHVLSFQKCHTFIVKWQVSLRGRDVNCLQPEAL